MWGEVCLKLPVVTRQHLILGVTIAGMSISRHLDQYLSERGLVQRAEVVPEDGCQEFCRRIVGLATCRRVKWWKMTRRKNFFLTKVLAMLSIRRGR